MTRTIGFVGNMAEVEFPDVTPSTMCVDAAMSIAIDIPKEKLRDFCSKWKVTEFALFGSAVRPEEFRGDSDVDVLVSFSDDADWSLFDHVHMRDELIEIFGREVDLLTRRSVEQSDNRFRRRSILSSVVTLDVA